MKKTAIIIFIKNPDLGRVKKRLAQSLGDENALEVYKQMLEHTRRITQSLNTDKYLFYDKVIDRNDEWLEDIYDKQLQSGVYMANRIKSAVKQILAKGYEHVVIIGSDCLELDERIIRLAFRQLEHFDYVLGPTKDGGFYLMGMSELNADIFNEQVWGTPSLSAEVAKTIHNAHKTSFMLSELAGVITVDDLSDDLKQLIK